MLSIKQPSETITVAFDFAALGTPSGTPTIIVAVESGTPDPSPSAILSGSPQIVGTKVLQQFTAGVDGTYYELNCTASVGTSVYTLTDVLPVISA